eukprot:Hpha_TRINITY_DN15322_c2_g2::TRINITY_DN15322_c2_g2_i1::g.91471::m.91471
MADEDAELEALFAAARKGKQAAKPSDVRAAAAAPAAAPAAPVRQPSAPPASSGNVKGKAEAYLAALMAEEGIEKIPAPKSSARPAAAAAPEAVPVGSSFSAAEAVPVATKPPASAPKPAE